MNYSISLHSKAESEYDDAYHWYLKENSGIEERFYEAISKKLLQIASAPELYSLKNSSCRASKVYGFPYLIIYKVDVRKKSNKGCCDSSHKQDA